MSNIEIHVSCSNGPSYSLQALGAQWEYCTISQGFCLCALFLPKYYLVVSLLDRINLIIHHLYLLLICIHIYNFFIIFFMRRQHTCPSQKKKKAWQMKYWSILKYWMYAVCCKTTNKYMMHVCFSVICLKNMLEHRKKDYV